MASAAQAKAFIDVIAPIAVKVCKERGYGNAQAWTCVAQACCESAYGTSGIMARAKAFFGIKATKSWVQAAKYGGKVYNASTKECYDGSTYTNITACFRAYDSMEDSVRDYFDLLESKRYKACLTRNTVKACITDIKNGGYATSPTYINTITSIYTKFQGQIEKYAVTSIAKDVIDEVAKEVIAGKWGNGDARKKRLTDAGYDYATVQKRVNEMLKNK
jgi:flagellum-specific peptidoglycan hydrolase FlgJ